MIEKTENKSMPGNKYNILCNIVMILTVLAFTARYVTVIDIDRGIFSPIRNVLMIIIVLLFAYGFFTISRDERKLWLTKKVVLLPSFVWLVLFFVVRIACFVHQGMDYGIGREIFFEFVFLVALCAWTVNGRVNLKLIAIMFIVINLVTNFIADVTDIVVYTNPNTGGILTALAMLLCLFFVKKNNKIKLAVIAVFWIFSLYNMRICDARSADVAMIVCVICILLCLVFKRLKPKTFVVLCLICSFLLTLTIYGFIQYNLSDNDPSFTAIEEKINIESARRYWIWQGAVISHKDNMVLGLGNSTLEMHERNAYFKEQWCATYGSDIGFVAYKWSDHNGYLGVLFVTGWIGFALFFFIMLDKILSSKALAGRGPDRWTSIVVMAIVIFCLIISHFEEILLTSRYYTWLIMMMLLAWDMPANGNKGIES